MGLRARVAAEARRAGRALRPRNLYRIKFALAALAAGLVLTLAAPRLGVPGLVEGLLPGWAAAAYAAAKGVLARLPEGLGTALLALLAAPALHPLARRRPARPLIDRLCPDGPAFADGRLVRPGADLRSPFAPGRPFVGRKAELAILSGFLEEGQGFAWMQVVGQAGVGKTRLVLEALGAADARGWDVGRIDGPLDLPALEGWRPRRDTALAVDAGGAPEGLAGFLALARERAGRHRVRVVVVGEFDVERADALRARPPFDRGEAPPCRRVHHLAPITAPEAVAALARALGRERLEAPALLRIRERSGGLPLLMVPMIEVGLGPDEVLDGIAAAALARAEALFDGDSAWRLVLCASLGSPLPQARRAGILPRVTNLSRLARLFPEATGARLDRELPLLEPAAARSRMARLALLRAPPEDGARLIRDLLAADPDGAIPGISRLVAESGLPEAVLYGGEEPPDGRDGDLARRLLALDRARSEVAVEAGRALIARLREEQHEAGMAGDYERFVNAMRAILLVSHGWAGQPRIAEKVAEGISCAISHLHVLNADAARVKLLIAELKEAVVRYGVRPDHDPGLGLSLVGLIVRRLHVADGRLGIDPALARRAMAAGIDPLADLADVVARISRDEISQAYQHFDAVRRATEILETFAYSVSSGFGFEAHVGTRLIAQIAGLSLRASGQLRRDPDGAQAAALTHVLRSNLHCIAGMIVQGVPCEPSYVEELLRHIETDAREGWTVDQEDTHVFCFAGAMEVYLGLNLTGALDGREALIGMFKNGFFGRVSTGLFGAEKVLHVIAGAMLNVSQVEWRGRRDDELLKQVLVELLDLIDRICDDDLELPALTELARTLLAIFEIGLDLSDRDVLERPWRLLQGLRDAAPELDEVARIATVTTAEYARFRRTVISPTLRISFGSLPS